jgi:predicted kinase
MQYNEPMRQTLFLMLGFPGAGKTTTARLIHQQTDAVHVWADYERRQMFDIPTHSHAESQKLYAHLNQVVENLLAKGKSVIYDTNFNFYSDREKLRAIAAKHGAQTIVVWVTTPKQIAKQRAVHDRLTRNGYEFTLPEHDFERMSNHLEPPHDDEPHIQVEGIGVTGQTVADLLTSLAHRPFSL